MKYILLLLLFISAPALADESPLDAWNDLLTREHYTIPKKGFKGNVVKALTAIHERYEDMIWATDEKAWGKEDYWASRSEFLANGMGDCDDFAAAYYFDALELGLKPELWVVYDEKHLASHAITVVNGYALDNQSKEILPEAEAQKKYFFLYGVGINGMWETTTQGEGFILGTLKKD